MAKLPKTHFDVISELRPGLVAHIASRLAASPCDRILSSDEIVDDGAIDAIERTIAAYALGQMAIRGQHLPSDTDVRTVKRLSPPDWWRKYLHTLNYEYNCFFHYMQMGRQTFFFRPNLVERLHDAEINVDGDLIRLPFKACMFVMDDQISRDALYAVQRRTAPREGAICAYLFEREVEGRRRLAIYAVQMKPGDRNGNLGLVVERTVEIGAGTRMDDALATKWERQADDVRFDGNDGWIVENDFQGDGQRFVRLVLNAAMYACSADPDSQDVAAPAAPAEAAGLSRKERQRLIQAYRAGSRLAYVDLGSRLPAFSTSGREGDLRSSERIRVRGHWRAQAHGAGWSLRKLIFVEPFWRGPDMAEAVGAAYVVK